MRAAVVWLAVVELAAGHVSLTFPAARFPPLDFLDSLRTRGPCGVPLPAHPSYTTLIVGQTYNFTWRMQYPHQGGYRLTLLDAQGKSVDQLAPLNGAEFAGTMDQTSLSERVKFNQPCEKCTVVLHRQAVEWGRSYTFHSCADVNIVDTGADSEECSGRGAKTDGVCQCEAGHTGDICQYLVHCQSDDDCQNGGKCMDEGGSIVRRACYCNYGFFGRNCESQFTGEPDDCSAYDRIDESKFTDYGIFNRRCFQSQSLNDNDSIFYRSVKDEVEVVLDFLTTSWVSIGWRPDGLDPSCRLFPDLEGIRTRRSALTTHEELERESFGTSPLSPSAGGAAVTPPTRIAQEGPRPLMPKDNGLLQSALQAPLHAMDCVDIVAGAVRDGRLRVQDMFSRDRSTPLEDYWYDGMDSLSAAAAVEVDGRTILMFRRSKQEIEPTDHPLGGSRQFVIWAKGQTAGHFSHAAPSALDKGPHSNMAFYSDDALSYHGDKNRGVLKVDLASRPKQKTELAFGVANTHHLSPLSAHPPVIILSSSPSTLFPEAIQDTPPTSPPPDSASLSFSLSSLVLPVILLLR